MDLSSCKIANHGFRSNGDDNLSTKIKACKVNIPGVYGTQKHK